MIAAARRIGVAVAGLATNEAERLQMALIVTIGVLLFLIGIMWGINAYWVKEVNLIFFVLGGIYLIVKGTQWRLIGAAALVGVGVQGLRDQDMSQGAVQGVQVLYKILFGLLFGFWLIAGLLSTWPFEAAPAMFFPFAAMIMVIAVTCIFFGIKGKVTAWIIIAYATGVIGIIGWKTLTPESWRTPEVKVEPLRYNGVGVERHPAWTVKGKDGALPVNVWSKSIKVPPGCRAKHAAGLGTVFQVRSRLHGGAWTLQAPKAKVPGDEFQVMIRKEGVLEMPSIVVCS